MSQTDTANNTTVESSGFLSTLYDGSASLGQFRASLGLVVAVILAIIVLLAGTYVLFYNDDNKYLTVEGRVLKSDCNPYTTYDAESRPRESYKCNLIISYQVDGETHSYSTFSRSGEGYVTNEPVSLWVDRDDHSQVMMAGTKNSTIAWIAIGGAAVVLAIAYLNYYLTHRYKIYASGQGAKTIVDIFR